MAKDFGNLKSYEENPNNIVRLDSSTGGAVKGGMDNSSYIKNDNSTQSNMTDNPASSTDKNRNNIVELKPADASQNDPQSFSNDPIIEANLRTNAEKQAKLERIRASSQPSGDKNKSAGEAPMKEYDQEQ